jgi:hypothetical protein
MENHLTDVELQEYYLGLVCIAAGTRAEEQVVHEGGSRWRSFLHPRCEVTHASTEARQTIRDRRLEMKRWFWVIMMSSLALLLVGCGTAKSDASMTVTNAEEVQRISPEEAKALLDSGEAALYDTRSTDDYQTQHAAGAISFPEEEVAGRIDELPDDGKAVIFYCT